MKPLGILEDLLSLEQAENQHLSLTHICLLIFLLRDWDTVFIHGLNAYWELQTWICRVEFKPFENCHSNLECRQRFPKANKLDEIIKIENRTKINKHIPYTFQRRCVITDIGSVLKMYLRNKRHTHNKRSVRKGTILEPHSQGHLH